MKKILIGLLIIVLVLQLQCSFGYSSKFKLMIDTMEIEYQNVHGKSLNEEIFNSYSLFVYGSPTEEYEGQRWKDVEDGTWVYGKNSGTEDGKRGEYWILGENAQGYVVHNHKFPVDIEPPTPPTQWTYAVIKDALVSWNDQSKYMDDFQKDYMLNSKLTRNGVAYDITATDIGLDKVRLENYATWKTKGTVYTQRYDKSGKKWSANFMVDPMAGNSEIEGYASFENGTKIILKPEDTEAEIPIEFGANVINVSDYAKEEHVKLIESELYIDQEKIAKVEGNNTFSISGDMIYTYTRKNDEYMVVLNFTVKSTLLTKFTTDMALTDVREYNVILIFGDEIIEEEEEDNSFNNFVFDEKYAEFEEIPPPSIKSITMTITDGNGKQNDLYESKITNTKFICAGQTIQIDVEVAFYPREATLSFAGDSSIFTFDLLTKKFEWEEPKSRNKKTLFPTLKGFEDIYKKNIKLIEVSNDGEITKYSLTYVIPYNTKQTLNSWSTLRKTSDDAFKINENKLFTRISKPYELVIIARNNVGADTKRVSLDVFERWDTLYNRDISKYIVKDSYGW